MNLEGIAVIPARMGSTRLPGKPLADICGIPLIGHVVQRARLASRIEGVYVATDDPAIAEVAERFGALSVLTSTTHRNGTDRVAEAVADLDVDFVVQVNGDEALVSPDDIDAALDALQQAPHAVGSLLIQDFAEERIESVFKVVTNLRGEVMMLSRSDIPSSSRNAVSRRTKGVFVTCYRKSYLSTYAQTLPTPLELIEDANELRVIESGYTMVTARSVGTTLSVDRPEDLEEVRRRMPADPWFTRYASASTPGEA